MLEDMQPDDPQRTRPLMRREYEQLVEAGVFEDEHIELLRGQLVVMTPQGEPHGDVVARLGRELTLLLGLDYLVRQHSPWAVSDDSVPEPDLVVVPDQPGRGERSALLVVEVSFSSLRKDRGIKAELYAEAGIPEYWIVDLVHGSIEIHTRPSAGRYTMLQTVAHDAVLEPTHLAGIKIPASTFRLQRGGASSGGNQ
jgi:Uma2 family endonuclease